MELKVLVAAARRGLAIIVVSAFLGAVAAVLVQRSMPEQYEASASLLLDPIAVLVPGQQPSFGDPERYVDAQLRILASAEIAERAARDLPGHDGEDVQEAISLTQITGSDVVEVTALAPAPEVASDMANALVTAYVTLRQEDAAAAKQAQVSAVEGRIAEVRGQLASSAPDGSGVSIDQGLLRNQLAELQAELTSVVVSDGVVDRTVVLDPATPPSSPERIALPLMLAIGTAAGALIGFAVAAIREYRAPRVISPAHAELLLGRPVAAEFAGRRAQDGSRRTAAQPAGRATGDMSRAATALASTVASSPARGARRQVCVSSAARDEGTLEVATALGAALANQGAVVAVAMLHDDGIDGGGPTAQDSSPRGAAPRPDANRWSADPGAGTRLTVWRPRPPSEVMRIENVHQLYTQLPQDCEVVVLHAPPVLSSPLSAQVARESDELVMVVQIGAELEADLVRAVHALRTAGADPHPVTYRPHRGSRRG